MTTDPSGSLLFSRSRAQRLIAYFSQLIGQASNHRSLHHAPRRGSGGGQEATIPTRPARSPRDGLRQQPHLSRSECVEGELSIPSSADREADRLGDRTQARSEKRCSSSGTKTTRTTSRATSRRSSTCSRCVISLVGFQKQLLTRKPCAGTLWRHARPDSLPLRPPCPSALRKFCFRPTNDIHLRLFAQRQAAMDVFERAKAGQRASTARDRLCRGRPCVLGDSGCVQGLRRAQQGRLHRLARPSPLRGFLLTTPHTGSTNIVTPQQFITDLSNLDRGGGAGLASHGKSGFTHDAAKKASKAPPTRPAELPQAALDRRFASSSSASSSVPPNPLPPQQPQQHRPATLTRAQPPPQPQGPRQPDRYQPQAGYYSTQQAPPPAPAPAEASPSKPVKKKKLFGF